MQETFDLQQLEQSLKERLSAKRVLAFLDIVDDTAAVVEALEDGVEILYVQHCDKRVNVDCAFGCGRVVVRQ